MIHKHTKKLVLFLHNNNPLWSGIWGEITTTEIADMMNVTEPAISGWRTEKKNGIDKKKLREGIESIFEYLNGDRPKGGFSLERAQEVYVSIFNPEVSVYEFGRMLGYETSQSQRIIDQQIYKKQLLFRHLFHERNGDGHKTAKDELLPLMQGYYHVFIDRGPATLVAPLRVRYLLRYQNKQVIRCKLNIPNYNPGAPYNYGEYDGFISIKNRRVFWIFEARGNDLQDFFHMITERPDNCSEKPFMMGKYLTTIRDNDETIAAEQVCLIRQDIPESQQTSFMHKSGKVEKTPFGQLIGELRK